MFWNSERWRGKLRPRPARVKMERQRNTLLLPILISLHALVVPGATTGLFAPGWWNLSGRSALDANLEAHVGGLRAMLVGPAVP